MFSENPRSQALKSMRETLGRICHQEAYLVELSARYEDMVEGQGPRPACEVKVDGLYVELPYADVLHMLEVATEFGKKRLADLEVQVTKAAKEIADGE